jgi:ribosomal protein L32
VAATGAQARKKKQRADTHKAERRQRRRAHCALHAPPPVVCPSDVSVSLSCFPPPSLTEDGGLVCWLGAEDPTGASFQSGMAPPLMDALPPWECSCFRLPLRWRLLPERTGSSRVLDCSLCGTGSAIDNGIRVD